jgi:hypothetical protein
MAPTWIRAPALRKPAPLQRVTVINHRPQCPTLSRRSACVAVRGLNVELAVAQDERFGSSSVFLPLVAFAAQCLEIRLGVSSAFHDGVNVVDLKFNGVIIRWTCPAFGALIAVALQYGPSILERNRYSGRCRRIARK